MSAELSVRSRSRAWRSAPACPAPHSANLSLVTMCTMHLLGAIANAGNYVELSIEGPDYYPWQDGLFLGDPYALEAGQVTIPDSPGWGVEINPAWLDKSK